MDAALEIASLDNCRYKQRGNANAEKEENASNALRYAYNDHGVTGEQTGETGLETNFDNIKQCNQNPDTRYLGVAGKGYAQGFALHRLIEVQIASLSKLVIIVEVVCVVRSRCSRLLPVILLQRPHTV